MTFKYPPPLERFHAGFDKRGPDECWPWRHPDFQGYGVLRIDGRGVKAHRFAYELWVGPIPEGLVIDHTCHNGTDCAGGRGCSHRACMNPAHLEAVTNEENLRRGKPSGPKPFVKTHCLRGHPYDEENTYQLPNSNKRYCRRCHREDMRSRRETAS